MCGHLRHTGRDFGEHEHHSGKVRFSRDLRASEDVRLFGARGATQK